MEKRIGDNFYIMFQQLSKKIDEANSLQYSNH